MNELLYLIQDLYHKTGLNPEHIITATTLTAVALTALIMYAVYLILNKFVEPLIDKITYKTAIKWDDIVFRHQAMRWVWILLPTIIGDLMMPAALSHYPTAQSAVVMMLNMAIVLVTMMIVIESVKSLFLLFADHERIDEIAEKMRIAQENGEEYQYIPSHSLKGLQQMIIVLIVGFAVILCISMLFGKNPLIVISGLGAAAAVLMLVFQDSILGVVAGVQLTANDMLQPGDWITAPKYEANGIVREVTLAAVKVQNWDKTIVTIPPYKLLSEGFQNWRGMQMSKGRRITRAINIDMTTIRYATDQEVARWSAEAWWHKGEDTSRMVNLTAFRMYLEHYLTTLPTMRDNMLYMIRELKPGPDGLPVEIYFFTSSTEWKKYEHVQADVTDQVLAMLPRFGLRVFQHPTGYDILNMRGGSITGEVND